MANRLLTVIVRDERDKGAELLHVAVHVPLEFYGNPVALQHQIRIALEEAKPGATVA